MYLSALGKITPAGQTARRDLRVSDVIWREDEVSIPGQIYGHAGQIHFEICRDAQNLQGPIDRVNDLDKAVQSVPVSERATTRMNAKLERCK